MLADLSDQPHRRFNALTGEWVFVLPHRTKCPWQGRVESGTPLNRTSYDPRCYLCPGNTRANQELNPKYNSTFIFTNDYASFLPETRSADASLHPLLYARRQAGTCRVICFSPRHNLTLAQMGAPEIRSVVDVWAKQVIDLGQNWRWVQVFENKGDIMGCSNPHPHGQVWASDFIPNEPAKELVQQRAWFNEKGSPLALAFWSHHPAEI
jgi:UDPglucose--hexose-1-phosphate uridylyltransferase